MRLRHYVLYISPCMEYNLVDVKDHVTNIHIAMKKMTKTTMGIKPLPMGICL